MAKIRLTDKVHSFQSNCYIISSDSECAVIDPCVPYEASLLSGELRYILLTHAHFDHILDIDNWVENTGATVIVSEHDQPSLSDPIRNCYKLYDGSERGYFGKTQGVNDGDLLPIGNETIRVISCPGHTIGSVSYLVGNDMFVGDTVFAGGGYGRCDLPTSSFTMLKDSINKICALDEGITMYPGHGTTTTIKQYKRDIGR